METLFAFKGRKCLCLINRLVTYSTLPPAHCGHNFSLLLSASRSLYFHQLSLFGHLSLFLTLLHHFSFLLPSMLLPFSSSSLACVSLLSPLNSLLFSLSFLSLSLSLPLSCSTCALLHLNSTVSRNL